MEVRLGNVKFGDVPIMIGSLFYKSDKKVIDHKRGDVNRPALIKELKSVSKLKEKTGLLHALDIIAETPEAMEKYLATVAELTDDPLLIGGLNEETRIAGYRKACELGLAGRCGINSVSPNTSEKELEFIKDSKIRFAIVQTLDPAAVYPEEKLQVLKGGLLDRCREAGITDVAVDVGIIDFTSVWLAAESIKAVKNELGLPAGCAPSNVAYQPLLKKKVSKRVARSMNVALNTMIQVAGADFILYGPLKAAGYIFEAVATVEGIKAYGERLRGRAVEKSHPLYKFLAKL
ncbi:MAG: hypothetical protein N3D12_03150 [Candidatus Methanomethyliaceae archaeon]|nr:hypothetical protein [Candidatus Methanomethyliaceae archaeon]